PLNLRPRSLGLEQRVVDQACQVAVDGLGSAAASGGAGRTQGRPSSRSAREDFPRGADRRAGRGGRGPAFFGEHLAQDFADFLFGKRIHGSDQWYRDVSWPMLTLSTTPQITSRTGAVL